MQRTPACTVCGRWDGTHSGGCPQTGIDYIAEGNRRAEETVRREAERRVTAALDLLCKTLELDPEWSARDRQLLDAVRYGARQAASEWEWGFQDRTLPSSRTTPDPQ